MGALISAGYYDVQCDKCPQRSEEYQKLHGCLGPVTQPVYAWDDFIWYECPKKVMPSWTYEFFSLYSLCRLTESWPMSGSILDQTYKFMQAALLVERVCSEAREQETKLNEKNHGK